jgi:hypothetical protein
MISNTTAPSSQMRRLGRSRRYADRDLPGRLRHWHAPRANRWERVCVVAGTLCTEWLDADGVAQLTLHAGDVRWVAPGSRWRVAQMHADAVFELEVHADDATVASAPQVVRAGLLDGAANAQPVDAADFTRLLAALDPGQRCLVRTRFDFAPQLRAVMAEGTGALCWHPLQADADGHAALIVHAPQAVGLLEYLGRDHAVIEAALAGALRGDVERGHWLRNTLARHLVIEEEMLFPAYLDAGGNAGWVRGLRNEHGHLRQALERLDEAAMQRRFLLLLDGHDEKEETIVYPDIVARIGVGNAALAHDAMSIGLPSPQAG